MTRTHATRSTALAALLGLLAFGCAADVDNADPELAFAGGKADFDEARPVAYGESIGGSVSGHAFSLFSLSADAGDRFELRLSRTAGDFDLRSVVYDSELSSIAHVPGSFEATAVGNRKAFEAGDDGGRLFVVVRADRYRGAGDFELTLACLGGPCAGDVPVPATEVEEIANCVGRARLCAFAQLDTVPAGDHLAASHVVMTCLDADPACTPAICDAAVIGDTTPRDICDSLTASVAFYAGQSAACRVEFDACMDSCTDAEQYSTYLELEDDEFEFWMTGEATCWESPFGASCDEYARGHADCGGTDFRAVDGTETVNSCYGYWRATEGAWLEYEDDNIDCYYICDVVEEACTATCEAGPTGDFSDCFQQCTTEHLLVEDDDYATCDF
ncbi:MAG: hypothetical protein JRH11_09650 [Deltaproteobacteria bacterium]|nr:hypothetical protein [Deltaproteobacteria bacterium]